MKTISSERIVYSAVRFNGLFVVEQINGTCEVGSGEKGFFKKDFLSDGFADCVVVDSTRG